MNNMIINEKIVSSIISVSKLPDADYVINPYIGCPHSCIYCYAEFMKRFTGHKEEWGTFLDYKIFSNNTNYNKIKGKKLLIGSVTDPYNAYEARYEITRNILKQISQLESHVELLTKSNLVTRDIDILKNMKDISVGISMTSLNPVFSKQIEPKAPPPAKRIEALKLLKDAGIKTYIFISPIFPEITDYKQIIKETAEYSDLYCFENLNLRGKYKSKVLSFISCYYPEYAELFHSIYTKKINNDYWDNYLIDIKYYMVNLPYRIYFFHDKIKKH